jgi:hypothetical protein
MRPQFARQAARKDRPRAPETDQVNMRGNQSFRQAVVFLAALALVQLLAGCEMPTHPSLAPAEVSLSKGGKGGSSGGSQGADIIRGDLVLSTADAAALATTCPSAGFSKNSWTLVFGKSGCLIITPLWASVLYVPYALTDDLIVNVQQDGRNGPITHIRLAGQDVDGPEGVWHNTDWIAVAQPVVPTTAGFTLNVHARNVEVWRTDSHLAGGNRIEMIGTVSIGDIVYPRQ